MNSTGRPSTPPLALISLPNSSHARLACVPYCALPPESTVGRPILMGFCAYARRSTKGPPTAVVAPPTRLIVRKSRRLMVDPPSRGRSMRPCAHPASRRCPAAPSPPPARSSAARAIHAQTLDLVAARPERRAVFCPDPERALRGVAALGPH